MKRWKDEKMKRWKDEKSKRVKRCKEMWKNEYESSRFHVLQPVVTQFPANDDDGIPLGIYMHIYVFRSILLVIFIIIHVIYCIRLVIISIILLYYYIIDIIDKDIISLLS